MEAVTYSTFRKDLRGYMNKTRDDAEPILVTAKDPTSNVVVMSARDYDNLMENLYVASNSDLMEKLTRSRKQFARGNVRVHGLLTTKMIKAWSEVPWNDYA